MNLYDLVKKSYKKIEVIENKEKKQGREMIFFKKFIVV